MKMNKRLKAISENIQQQATVTDEGLRHEVILTQDDYIYLFHQAERVQELEDMLETSTYIQRMLRKEKRRYKQAIEGVLKYKHVDEGLKDQLRMRLKGESE